MSSGYDLSTGRFLTDVTINYSTGNCGQGVTAGCGGSLILSNASLDDVLSAVGVAESRLKTEQQIFRRSGVQSAINSSAFAAFRASTSGLADAREGLTFEVTDPKVFLTFLGSNFIPKGGGSLYGEHTIDVGGCGPGSKCRDYRSPKNRLGVRGSVQIVYDSSNGFGYIDIDRFNPYQFPGGTFGHLGELMAGPRRTGVDLYRLTNLQRRYRGY